MTEHDWLLLIDGCRKQERDSQKRLFKLYYNYAMSVSTRYTPTFEEAEEITNDAFMKVFARIATHYTVGLSFKGWLRRIVVNTAIDKFRAAKNQPDMMSLDLAGQVEHHDFTIEKMSAEHLLTIIQQLPISYQKVFNLYVIDDYTHAEIADMLGISEGASKSTLSRARQKLKELINKSSAIS